MASSHRESYGPLKFSNKSPHFFKIILQKTLLDGKIEIPKEFIKNYGKCMSGPAALLRVPSGEVWKIEVRKCDGNVWLRKGWRQFSNHYSLKRGQFVVFSYEGKCNFDVVIMDTTASEIQYPYTRNYVMHNSKKFPEIESESEDDIPPSRKSREKSADLPCPRPHKKMRGASYQSQGEAAVKRKAKGLNGCCDSLNFLQRAKALQLARAFKSENPSFTVVMQPSYVHKGLVCIPENFAKRCFKKMHTNMQHEVLLCVSDEKSWPVKYYQNTDIGRNAKFNGGWRQFVQDNDLEVGNVCVFELVTEFKFKVTIYRKQVIKGNSSDKSGADVVKIECDEGLEINAESNPVHHKGDLPICNMQNQNLTGETCNANDGGDKSDDFWLSLITECPGKVLEEAGEKIQNSDYIQYTNLQD